MKDMELNVKIMPHAMKGMQYTEDHPEDRARDLLDAFIDGSIDIISTDDDFIKFNKMV